ncbi:transglycosylase domain-containing protein [Kribbella sp. NPDC050124]|uniref:Rieske (2Fe-2S) protein n=1 Tax=Kribbella sp. NPDC050124 TaxID=3364114 RepID=UPI0037A9AADF
MEGGTINCNCHGSRFNISDGSVVNGPATQPLPAKPIAVPAEVKAATAVSYQRKLIELRYAIAVESELTKSEILERHLNLVNFGDGTYGVQVGSR